MRNDTGIILAVTKVEGLKNTSRTLKYKYYVKEAVFLCTNRKILYYFSISKHFPPSALPG